MRNALEKISIIFGGLCDFSVYSKRQHLVLLGQSVARGRIVDGWQLNMHAPPCSWHGAGRLRTKNRIVIDYKQKTILVETIVKPTWIAALDVQMLASAAQTLLRCWLGTIFFLNAQSSDHCAISLNRVDMHTEVIFSLNFVKTIKLIHFTKIYCWAHHYTIKVMFILA